MSAQTVADCVAGAMVAFAAELAERERRDRAALARGGPLSLRRRANDLARQRRRVLAELEARETGR